MFFDRVLHSILADFTEEKRGTARGGRSFDALILMQSCALRAMHKMCARKFFLRVRLKIIDLLQNCHRANLKRVAISASQSLHPGLFCDRVPHVHDLRCGVRGNVAQWLRTS
jgi:hypothetical protein